MKLNSSSTLYNLVATACTTRFNIRKLQFGHNAFYIQYDFKDKRQLFQLILLLFWTMSYILEIILSGMFRKLDALFSADVKKERTYSSGSDLKG